MNWLDPITLTGKHICLEPLDPNRHAAPMFRHFDPKATEFLYRGGKSIETVDDLRQHLTDLNAIPKRINWAIRMLAAGGIVGEIAGDVAGEIAGRISYSEVKEADKWIEIGTMLMPAFWGGYANPESKLLLMTHAFERLGANRVQFKVDARNGRSQGSMAKLGAVREGVLRQYQIRQDGYARDSVMYSVLRDEWPAVKAKLEQRL